jgi:HK97 family phage major capsid protein
VTIDIGDVIRGKTADDLGNGTPDELRGMTPDDLQQFVEILDAHLRSIHQDENTGELRDKSPAEQTAFDYGLGLRDKAIAKIDEHRAVQEVFKRRPKAVEAAMLNLGASRDKNDPYGDVRRMNNPEARDRALRVLDDRNSSMHLSAPEKDEVERQIRTSPDIARRILVTENDDYREAWMKLVTEPHPMLSAEQQQAVRAFNEYRAASEGTTTAGGFGIPVFIDPSIIMTAQGSGNPFLTLARQVDVNTNVWKGVSSAGVTWAFQAEAAAATDNMATLAQPSVTVFMARGFIPYSIEIGQDYPGFASEMQTLLSAGYDELLVDKFTRGSGTNEPKGILTCLSANTNVRVRAATNVGAISAADPYALWQAVPQRNRRNAAWLMNVSLNNAIRQLGTANVYHATTVTLPDGAVDTLFARGVYESPYMPSLTTTTTATEGYVIAGDFSNYVIARRGGMSVELIPQIFQQATAGSAYGMPTGQRGWFAYSRIGGSSANDLGFRLLVNT